MVAYTQQNLTNYKINKRERKKKLMTVYVAFSFHSLFSQMQIVTRHIVPHRSKHEANVG